MSRVNVANSPASSFRGTDPRQLQRRASEGDLRHVREAAAKKHSIHPAVLKTQPVVCQESKASVLPLHGPFREEADRARAYAAHTIAEATEHQAPFRITSESLVLFKAAPPNVAFCGVVSLKDRTAYLCPLVPLMGSKHFPEEKVNKLEIAPKIPATPIVHTDIKTRQATGTGEASHDQLAKRVGAADDCIGFTIWKGDNGDAVNFSFTSRSQNTSKFGQCATAAQVAEEARKNKIAIAAAGAQREAYQQALKEFEAAKPIRDQQLAEAKAAWERNPVGPPPPPTPPLVAPSPEQFGFKIGKQKSAMMTAIQAQNGTAPSATTADNSAGKGTNDGGIVSLPYAIAVLDTLQVHFNAGVSNSAEAPT